MVESEASMMGISSEGDALGLIRPPPDIRAIVEKTAQFVARNGKTFETRILSSAEGQSAKFAFMKAGHAYHAWYEYKIRECEENGGDLKEEKDEGPEEEEEAPQEEEKVVVATSKKETTNALARVLQSLKSEDVSLPVSFMDRSSTRPVALSPLESEIVILTAQYTAASGRQFLSGLAQREQRNPQFDFLKPTHVLFGYFTSLVDAYAKTLAPKKDLREDIDKCANDGWRYCLSRIAKRWDFSRRADEAERRQRASRDAERMAFQAVDWHDFVVVETIDFNEDELSSAFVAPSPSMRPPPEETPLPPPPPAPREEVRVSSDVRVVSDYAPRVASGAAKGPTTMIDPITGNEVPIDRMTEHMRIQLLDPKWREEQRRLAALRGSTSEETTTQVGRGDQIAQSLATFARQRHDIFGSDEEAALKNDNQKDDDNKIIWDGHGGSINRVQQQVLGILHQDNQAAMQRQQQHFYQQQQYPPGMMGAPPGMGVVTAAAPPIMPPGIMRAPVPAAPFIPPPPPPPPHFEQPPIPAANTFTFPPPAAPPAFIPPPPPPPPMEPMEEAHPPPAVEDQPEAKRPRVDPETGLMSESDFLKVSGGDPNAPHTLTIQIPKDDSNPDWRLQGQALALDCTVVDTIRTVKEKLSKHLGNMPATKQQLRSPTLGFLKDSLTLAHFNIANGSMLDLVVRSRGRR